MMASVIGLMLAEWVFSYPRLNRFRPRFTDLMVSLLQGETSIYWFFTCFLPRTRALGLGFLGRSPHLNGLQVIIDKGLKCELNPVGVTLSKPVISKYFY